MFRRTNNKFKNFHFYQNSGIEMACDFRIEMVFVLSRVILRQLSAFPLKSRYTLFYYWTFFALSFHYIFVVVGAPYIEEREKENFSQLQLKAN